METENKAVLISIQPKWCELIADGEKTVEVRKTKPKLKPPFKCYIYCTKSTQSDQLWVLNENERKENFGLSAVCGNLNATAGIHRGNGKVIGEFVCDRIDIIDIIDDPVMTYIRVNQLNQHPDICITAETCLNINQLQRYLNDKKGYGWHISDLKIYDEPIELSEFGLTRPPQSWCYVEEG